MKAPRKIFGSDNFSDYIAELRASKATDGNGNIMFPELPAAEESLEVAEPVDEREALKAILKEYGVPFGGNTSTAKLKEMVDSMAL